MANSALIKALAATALVSCAMLLAGCGEKPPEKPRRSAVGIEAVKASTHCAVLGGDCKCDGGFVIYGAGTDLKDFETVEDFAKWDVYPKRLGSDTISCTPEVLGSPYPFGGSAGTECRCVKADLKCSQLTKPWANGCGAGANPSLLDLVNKWSMSPDQIKCCNRHDICYSLCGKTKEQCDDDFDSSLAKTCGGHACKAKIAMMSKIVRTKAGEVAYSGAQRHDELFTVTDWMSGSVQKEENKTDEGVYTLEVATEKKADEDVTEKKADEDKKEEKTDTERLYSTKWRMLIDAAFGRLTTLGAIVTTCALLAMAVTGYVVRIRHMRATQYRECLSTQDNEDESVGPLL